MRGFRHFLSSKPIRLCSIENFINYYLQMHLKKLLETRSIRQETIFGEAWTLILLMNQMMVTLICKCFKIYLSWLIEILNMVVGVQEGLVFQKILYLIVNLFRWKKLLHGRYYWSGCALSFSRFQKYIFWNSYVPVKYKKHINIINI